MKIVMVFDQIQAGAGIKDDHMVSLGLMKGAVGPAIMMEPYLKTYNGQVLACLYCGDGYYAENKQECLRKYCAMVEKIKPDVVMCGPAFDYLGFGRMAAEVAQAIQKAGVAQAFAALSAENEETIAAFKDCISLVKTPKKGWVGLDASLRAMCEIAHALYTGADIQPFKQKYCF